MHYYELFLEDVTKDRYTFKKGEKYLVVFADRGMECIRFIKDSEKSEVWFEYTELKEKTELISGE